MISKGILVSGKTKNKLYQESLKINADTDIQYRSYRNKLTHTKEMAKKLITSNS